jgi:hypothetical protein
MAVTFNCLRQFEKVNVFGHGDGTPPRLLVECQTDYIHTGQSSARCMLEAVPMCKDFHAKFTVFNHTVAACDKVIHAKWNSQYAAWASGNRSVECPFKTEDYACMFLLVVATDHLFCHDEQG